MCKFNCIGYILVIFAAAVNVVLADSTPYKIEKHGYAFYETSIHLIQEQLKIKNVENKSDVGDKIQSDEEHCQSSNIRNETCYAKSNWKVDDKRIFQQINDWIQMLKKTEMVEFDGNNEDALKPDITAFKNDTNSLYSITTCKSTDSIWNYKYVGLKKKNRMFYGKGKLSFTGSSSPPHGYDYGMKSGHCLKMTLEHQKTIEI